MFKQAPVTLTSAVHVECFIFYFIETRLVCRLYRLHLDVESGVSVPFFRESLRCMAITKWANIYLGYICHPAMDIAILNL